MQHTPKTICLIANAAFTLLNFRKELIATLVAQGHCVVAIAPVDCLFLPGQNIVDRFANMGVDFIPCEFERVGTNPVADLKSMWALYKILRHVAPDVVLNYTVKPTIYGSLAAWWAGATVIASNITGAGSILTARTGLKNKILSKVLFGLYRSSLRRNTVVFFQNPDDLKMFQDKKLLGQTPTKILNGSGVDLEYFKRHMPLPETPKFLFVGRLLIEKGIWEYVRAAQAVKAQYPQAVFSILGHLDEGKGGFTQQDLDAAIATRAIAYHPPQSDIRPLLEDHTVLVLPSYREGTPRAVLEAMALSMPIITTDAPGCRETVQEGENGFLVPVESSDELIERMIQMIEDPGLIPTMGQTSRQIAETKYNVQKIVADIMMTVGLKG